MPNLRPRGLTAIAALAVGDVLPIDDLSEATSTQVAKITVGQILDQITGDITVDSVGVSTIGAGAVDNAMLAGAIAASK